MTNKHRKKAEPKGSAQATAGDVAPQAIDLTDPELVAFLRWSGVYAAWTDGDPAPMGEWLRDSSTVLTQDGREFLAALAEGNVKRRAGRRGDRDGWVERAIVLDVFKLRDSGSTQADAIATAAARRGMKEDAVRGVVEKLRALGITLDNWRRWGCPPL